MSVDVVDVIVNWVVELVAMVEMDGMVGAVESSCMSKVWSE